MSIQTRFTRSRWWIGALAVFAITFGLVFTSAAPFAGANTPSSGIQSTTFTLADDGQSIDYRVVVRNPDSQVIGLRLHLSNSWPRPAGRSAGLAIAVLDHRSRTPTSGGSFELTGSFDQSDLTDAQQGPFANLTIRDLANIIENGIPAQRIEPDGIDVVVATTGFPTGAYGASIGPVRTTTSPTTSTLPPTTRPPTSGTARVESASFTADSDGTMSYRVVVRDLDAQVIGLRLHTPGTWPAPARRFVIAFLDHRDRTTNSDGSIEFAGTFTRANLTEARQGPFANISMPELVDIIDSGRVDVAVATTEFRNGAIGATISELTTTTPPAPASGAQITSTAFTLSADGQSMNYRVVVQGIDSPVIGLRLHPSNTWPVPAGRSPGLVIAVLDHRSRTTNSDGSIEFAGSFTQASLTRARQGPFADLSILDLADVVNNGVASSGLDPNRIDVVVVTLDERTGEVGVPVGRIEKIGQGG